MNLTTFSIYYLSTNNILRSLALEEASLTSLIEGGLGIYKGAPNGGNEFPQEVLVGRTARLKSNAKSLSDKITVPEGIEPQLVQNANTRLKSILSGPPCYYCEQRDENLVACRTEECPSYFHDKCNTRDANMNRFFKSLTKAYNDRCSKCRKTCQSCQKDFSDEAKIVECQRCGFLVHEWCTKMLETYINHSEVDSSLDPKKPICKSCANSPQSPIHKIRKLKEGGGGI
jgi:hypothetical protein